MMTSSIVTALLWIAALSSGLIAGVYFAFSVFIMQAFGKIETSHAVVAMNAINETILRSLFMPLFFGSTIVAVMLMIVAMLHWDDAGSGMTLTAGAIYFIGMFVCTVVVNVPLNNLLAGVNEDSANAEEVWPLYLKTWTLWNHLRTVSSLVTCGLGIWLLSTQ
ncbi:MAG: anthrone oxygenase family protein [Pseudomonadota bacterium]